MCVFVCVLFYYVFPLTDLITHTHTHTWLMPYPFFMHPFAGFAGKT
jgi:hypothetical protein